MARINILTVCIQYVIYIDFTIEHTALSQISTKFHALYCFNMIQRDYKTKAIEFQLQKHLTMILKEIFFAVVVDLISNHPLDYPQKIFMNHINIGKCSFIYFKLKHTYSIKGPSPTQKQTDKQTKHVINIFYLQ